MQIYILFKIFLIDVVNIAKYYKALSFRANCILLALRIKKKKTIMYVLHSIHIYLSLPTFISPLIPPNFLYFSFDSFIPTLLPPPPRTPRRSEEVLPVPPPQDADHVPSPPPCPPNNNRWAISHYTPFPFIVPPKGGWGTPPTFEGDKKVPYIYSTMSICSFFLTTVKENHKIPINI